LISASGSKYLFRHNYSTIRCDYNAYPYQRDSVSVFRWRSKYVGLFTGLVLFSVKRLARDLSVAWIYNSAQRHRY